jgi:hemerythrin-like domain-containing protein
MTRFREELEKQHAWLETTLNALVSASEGKSPTDVAPAWAEFEHGLMGHLDFEEDELFPLVEPFHAEGVQRLRQEHARIRKLVSELGVAVDLHTLHRSEVDALAETLRRHAEHEDRTLHHWIEENAPEDTRRHLFGLLIRAVRNAARAEHL